MGGRPARRARTRGARRLGSGPAARGKCRWARGVADPPACPPPAPRGATPLLRHFLRRSRGAWDSRAGARPGVQRPARAPRAPLRPASPLRARPGPLASVLAAPLPPELGARPAGGQARRSRGPAGCAGGGGRASCTRSWSPRPASLRRSPRRRRPLGAHSRAHVTRRAPRRLAGGSAPGARPIGQRRASRAPAPPPPAPSLRSGLAAAAVSVPEALAQVRTWGSEKGPRGVGAAWQPRPDPLSPAPTCNPERANR